MACHEAPMPPRMVLSTVVVFTLTVTSFGDSSPACERHGNSSTDRNDAPVQTSPQARSHGTGILFSRWIRDPGTQIPYDLPPVRVLRISNSCKSQESLTRCLSNRTRRIENARSETQSRSCCEVFTSCACGSSQ